MPTKTFTLYTVFAKKKEIFKRTNFLYFKFSVEFYVFFLMSHAIVYLNKFNQQIHWTIKLKKKKINKDMCLA